MNRVLAATGRRLMSRRQAVRVMGRMTTRVPATPAG
jgi:hypothetical protein